MIRRPMEDSVLISRGFDVSFKAPVSLRRFADLPLGSRLGNFPLTLRGRSP